KIALRRPAQGGGYRNVPPCQGGGHKTAALEAAVSSLKTKSQVEGNWENKSLVIIGVCGDVKLHI
ncbi:hypothetical protein KI387_009009, partial [Taxus chinensis]